MTALTGKTALVTGGGRGIGRGIALALAALGANVAVLARSADQVNRVAEEVRAKGVEALAVTGDVADYESMQRAVERVQRELGEIDILVNNAGVVTPIDALVNTDPAAWVQTQAINVNGCYYLMRLIMPGMLARGFGRVINISSGAARGTGVRHLGAYSVSKAALDMLSRSAGAEVDGTGVTVNSVYPGTVDTEMVTVVRETPAEHASQQTYNRFQEMKANHQLTDPLDVGRLISGLALTAINGTVGDVRDAEFRGQLEAALADVQK